MNYRMLVNKDNQLDKTYIPNDLVNSKSIYKKNILISKKILPFFKLMKEYARKKNYYIDIMSGYRTYEYQEKLYNKLFNEKGINYTFRHLAKPGCSEHQTGLAIDICIYKDEKCYIEHELELFDEILWIQNNAHYFGFILRYPFGCEEKTGYNYEPWHFRYVGNIASYLYYNHLTLEQYYKKTCN